MSRDLGDIEPLHGRQNDLCPPDMLLGTVGVGNDRLQPLAIAVMIKDANRLSPDCPDGLLV